jgi:uncharacterized protein
MTYSLLLLALVLQQNTPTGGAISKFVPPVPTPESFISDQRSVLTAEQRRALDARITRIQQAGLGDIAVAILPSIGSYSPNQVAVEIYRTWKVGSIAAVGSAHRNVGVLLLIVPKELAPDNRGQCWINTGTGAEGIITDATAGALCRDSIVPHLRNRDYSGAIGAAIGGLEARLRGDSALASTPVVPAVGSPGPTAKRSAALPIVFGGFIALIIAAVGGRRYMRYRQRTCGKCKRGMRRLDERADNARLEQGQRVEEEVKSVDYDVWVCECGESKVIAYKRAFSKYSECRKCHRRTAKSKYVTLVSATTSSTGLAENRFTCKNCRAEWKERVVLPEIVEATASSGSSSSSSGGGGGGSSFGGSGSTSGGGGGSSY